MTQAASTTATASEKSRLTPFVACYVDLIGQGEAMRAWVDQSDPRVLARDANAKYIASIRAVQEVRGAMRNAFEVASKSTVSEEQYSMLPEDARNALKAWTSSDLQIQSFSDTTIGFARLIGPSGVVSIRDVSSALQAVSVAFLAVLACGRLARGSIDVGYGTDAFAGELYGPVLLSVYDLERTVADFPRVVVGSGLRRLVSDARAETRREPIHTLNRLAAESAAEFIKPCSDGSWVVDYLGEAMRPDTKSDWMRILVREAQAFVRRTADEAVTRARSTMKCDPNAFKHARRLTLLRDYFDRNADRWLA